MRFSRQEYWSGSPFPPPGDLPNPGIEPVSLTSPALAGGFLTTEPPVFVQSLSCVWKRILGPVIPELGVSQTSEAQWSLCPQNLLCHCSYWNQEERTQTQTPVWVQSLLWPPCSPSSWDRTVELLIRALALLLFPALTSSPIVGRGRMRVLANRM